MRNALEIKGHCLGMQGQWDKAIQLFEEVHWQANHPLKGLAPLAYAYVKTGQTEKVQAIIAKMEQWLAEEPESVSEINLVGVWWALGDKDKAFHYLFQALDKGMAIIYGLYSPLLEGMEKDPRTAEIKKRMNL